MASYIIIKYLTEKYRIFDKRKYNLLKCDLVIYSNLKKIQKKNIIFPIFLSNFRFASLIYKWPAILRILFFFFNKNIESLKEEKCVFIGL